MNIFSMMRIILRVADAVVRKSALPDFAFAPQFRAQRVRISAFDELDRALNGYVVRRGKQQMNVLGHDDKCMQLKTSLATISVHGLEKQSHVRFHNEQPASLPGEERNKIKFRAGR